MITGGLGGYGLSITNLMLKRGARVWICDIQSQSAAQQRLKDSGLPDLDKVRYCECDVSNADQFEAAFKSCIEENGFSPDVLINGAAINDESDWNKVYEVNLVSFLFMTVKCPPSNVVF